MVYEQYPVRIPKDAYPQKDGRVNIIVASYPKYKRIIVGWVCEEGKMHPTDAYFLRYQDEWKDQYPEEASMLHCTSIGVGLFALTLGIGSKTGIYQALVEVYKAEIANGIMDFAMYNILSSSNCVNSFAPTMNDKMLFSILPKDDAWYSELFNYKMNEQCNNIIRSKWIQACIDNGITEAYISIDGTNIDYAGQNNDLAKKGNGKSGKNITIVSCIWVICASGEHRGLPLTYFVTEGNTVDSKAFRRVIDFLKYYKIQTKGAIVDRGFCTDNVIRALHDENIDYVVMLKENTIGYQHMLEKYKYVIKDHLTYSFKEDGKKYGIVDRDYILSSFDFESNIVLIFDTLNYATRRVSFLKEVFQEEKEINSKLKNGEFPGISTKYRDFMSIDCKAMSVRIDMPKLESAAELKGYYALGTSVNASADEIDKIYNLRDASKKTFAQVKTAFGFNAIRSDSEEGVMNRIFCVFIASILRSEIMNSCMRHNLITNRAIIQLSEFGYVFNHNYYAYASSLPIRLKPLFADFGLNDDSIKSIENIVNIRYQAEEGSQYSPEMWTIQDSGENKYSRSKRAQMYENADIGAKMNAGGKIPDPNIENDSTSDLNSFDKNQNDQSVDGNSENKAPKKRGRKPKPKEEKPRGPGRGRVRGSKNKKTLERERLIAEGKLELPKKRSAGRPKSPETLERENRWKRIREIASERGIDLPEKRKPGYPSNAIREIEAQIDQEDQNK